MSVILGQVFILQNYGTKAAEYVVITPIPLSQEEIVAAWSYAVRYTAKGLDLPDHSSAIKMLQQRHPSWTVIQTTAMTVGVNLPLADKDQPES
jgi:hypothetical protein